MRHLISVKYESQIVSPDRIVTAECGATTTGCEAAAVGERDFGFRENDCDACFYVVEEARPNGDDLSEMSL